MPDEFTEGMNTLGQHLRMLRKRRSWSQGTLSRESGVSEVTIRAIERNYPNARRRSRATLVALSRALGLPNEHLAGYQDSPAPEDLEGQPAAAGGGREWPGVIRAIQDRVAGSEFTEADLVCFSVMLGWPPHHLINILHRQPQGDGEPGYPWPDSSGTKMLGLLDEIRQEIGLVNAGAPRRTREPGKPRDINGRVTEVSVVAE